LILTNLHTHTTYSDGKNSLEEYINKAIELGFDSIGFSEHAQCGYDIDCKELARDEQVSYFNLLDELNEKHENIDIFKGLELDSLNGEYKGNPDYTIGSVHCLLIENKIYFLDYNAERLRELISVCGGIKPFITKYYQELLNFAKNVDYDIVGHLDLYTKFNEKEPIFNINEKWYKDIIYNVIEELNKLDKIIEINTGAIARGYRSSPYPDLNTIKTLKQLDSKIIVGSDAHTINGLNCYFSEVENILKSLDIKNIYKFTKNGFIETSL
jgi:histidinol-phosphatase (PHP family)